MKKEQTKAVSFDFIGGKDVMPIGGFYGPYSPSLDRGKDIIPEYVSKEIFQLIAEAGINLITASADDYAVLPEKVIKSLELGEEFGIGIFVQDGNIFKGIGNESFTVEEAKNAISKYAHYASYCGVHLVDEPDTSYYLGEPGVKGPRDVSNYGHIAKILQEDIGLYCYSNMFPTMYAEDKVRNYKRYVEEFCETIRPKILIWDYYPFDKCREERWPMYFWNMDIIRQYSNKMNVPFWASIQAGSQWAEGGLVEFDSEMPYYPNEAQFNWNINTCLAFGVQGFQYFPLIEPYHFAYGKSTEWDFERNGIIGAAGNKTQWFHYAKKINQHIRAIDEVLMNSVNKGIIVSGEEAIKNMELTTCVIETGRFEELLAVAGDAMVGCFNFQGKTALYVVNHSMQIAQNIELEFIETENIRVIQNAKETYVTKKHLTLNMAPGEGVLLVIQQCSA